MFVPSYQMHNVLNVYAKKLERQGPSRRQVPAEPAPPVEKIRLTAEGKRQSVIDKVAATIADRITRFGPQDEIDRQIVERLNQEVAGQHGTPDGRGAEFRFNRIDAGEEKRTDTLKVDDGRFVYQRLEQIAREAVDRQMVSPKKAPEPGGATEG